MDVDFLEIGKLIVGPAGGLLGGWVIASRLAKMYEAKDNQLVSAMEDHIQSQREETKACNDRYNMIYSRVCTLEDRVK